MFAFLLVALLVLLSVAIVGWFRPLPTKPLPAPTYSNQQVADAKTKVCAAYERVHHAVLANTGRSGGSDSTATLAVAANARLTLYDGGEYLLKTLTQEPATPADLTEATRALVSAYQELAVDYMTEATDPEINSSFSSCRDYRLKSQWDANDFSS
jgi:NH3-dependent NAD+ synthetase